MAITSSGLSFLSFCSAHAAMETTAVAVQAQTLAIADADRSGGIVYVL